VRPSEKSPADLPVSSSRLSCSTLGVGAMVGHVGFVSSSNAPRTARLRSGTGARTRRMWCESTNGCTRSCLIPPLVA
jgi:hypothetical protein